MTSTPSSKRIEQARLSRRRFLAGTGGFAAMAGMGFALRGATEPEPVTPGTTEPFWGPHQGGIVTPEQSQTYFSAFDLVTTERDDIVKMLQQWTAAAARLTAGKTAELLGADATVPTPDSGDIIGLPPSRLTITFGFGPGLFTKEGKDRYNLATRRPAALVDLPKFTGDQLQEARTGGDISVQACADNPQVAFHAVRQLARLAYNTAQMRWVQTGFSSDFGVKVTARNLMGFKDGTNNLSTTDSAAMDKFVWAGAEGPAWMRGGSYLVARRIRIALEHWDRMNLAFQEQTIGRHKISGAPLGGAHEFDKSNFETTNKDGDTVISENAHNRLAAEANNDGAQILRRPYSYNDGANITAERWPPWRQEMEFDAGLFFLAYQRDPRTGFIKIFKNMAKFDMMNQFVTHTGGGIFACPPGVAAGEFIGQRLFEKS